MRVSLINLNLIAKDAIGRSLMDKARCFRDRGDEVRVYVQSIADDVPGDVRALCVTCNLAQLVGGDNWPAGQREHFFASDLYVYDYPNWYELVESIREVDRGVVVFDYHGVTPPELWGSEEALGMLRRSLDELPDLLSHADYAIGHSAFTHGELVERYGFRADRAFMFPYAVPLEDFSPGERDPEMVRRYGLAGQRVLLYVGRMAGNKRVDLLVRALPLIRQEYPETMLLLVGDDRSSAYAPLVADVKRLARELGVEKRVVFTGPVPHLPPYYRLADVYVTSSLHEGFCVPLIEAMASGLPVVGTNSTAIPHTLGDAGLTFAPEDVEGLAEQVLSLFRDPALAQRLGQRGRPSTNIGTRCWSRRCAIRRASARRARPPSPPRRQPASLRRWRRRQPRRSRRPRPTARTTTASWRPRGISPCAATRCAPTSRSSAPSSPGYAAT